MKIIQSEHDLLNDICCLLFCKTLKLTKSFKKFATFNDFWDYVVILLVFHEVNNSDYLRMTLTSKNRKLVLQKFKENLPFIYHGFLHYFNRKLGIGVSMTTPAHFTECTRSKKIAHLIFHMNIFDILKLLIFIEVHAWFLHKSRFSYCGFPSCIINLSDKSLTILQINLLARKCRLVMIMPRRRFASVRIEIQGWSFKNSTRTTKWQLWVRRTLRLGSIWGLTYSRLVEIKLNFLLYLFEVIRAFTSISHFLIKSIQFILIVVWLLISFKL